MLNLTDSEQYRWHLFADQESLWQAAFSTIRFCADHAIKTRGQFHLVLAGGETPRNIYKKLVAIETDWLKWYIYFTDERCLLPEDNQRNSYMATEVFLKYVPIPCHQIYLIHGESGALRAARDYNDRLGNTGWFDLVLLGLGEDGHTASLFPGHESGAKPDSPDALAVFYAPKPPAERVSLSAVRLSRSHHAMCMVSGASKRQAVLRWLSGDDIPVRHVMPASGMSILLEAGVII